MNFIRKILSKVSSIAREIVLESYALYPLQKMRYVREYGNSDITLSEDRVWSEDGFGNLNSGRDLKIDLVTAFKRRKKMKTGESELFEGKEFNTYFGYMPNNMLVDKLSDGTVRVYSKRRTLNSDSYLVSSSEEELIKYRKNRSTPVIFF